MAELYIFIPKLSQMILYDFIYISNRYESYFCIQLGKYVKFGYLNLDSNLWPLVYLFMQNKI